MNCSVKDLDLTRVPFGRTLSRLYIVQRGEQLCLGLTGGELLSLAPMVCGEEASFSYRAMPRSLELFSKQGALRFIITDNQVMRSWGVLPMQLTPLTDADFTLREDGGVAVDFGGGVRLLLVPLNGNLRLRDGKLLVCPGEDDRFDVAIHDFGSDAQPYDSYVSIEDALADAQQDYDCWLARYGEAFPQYEHLKQLAAYITWVSIQKNPPDEPNGYLRTKVLFTRRCDGAAEPWLQAFHAMACMRQTDVAFYFIDNMFAYQREDGALPSRADFLGADYGGGGYPLQGIALLALSDAGGNASSLYNKLKKLLGWWRKNRWNHELNLPIYSSADQCETDGAPFLGGLTPVTAPELASFMIHYLDAMGRMAHTLGLEEERKDWAAQSKTLEDALLTNLWDGQRFFARGADGKPLDIYPSSFLLPVSLGPEHLPMDVYEKLCAELKARLSPGLGVTRFAGGDDVWLPHQLWFAAALSRWGKSGLAMDIAHAVFEQVDNCGFFSCSARGDVEREGQWDTAAAISILNLVNLL